MADGASLVLLAKRSCMCLVPIVVMFLVVPFVRVCWMGAIWLFGGAWRACCQLLEFSKS